jgi:hypothetical protein
MENNEEKASSVSNKRSSAPACRTEPRRSIFENADNHDLWVWEKSPKGDVPEVNGGWANEIREFVPTSGELLVLAEHWTDVAIWRTYVEWANAPYSVSTDHWRRVYFAWRRVYRIRELLGDVIDKLIDDQIKTFHDEEDGNNWDPEKWKEFLRLIDRKAQEKHLAHRRLSFDF